MAAELKMKLIAELSGLGEEITMAKSTSQTTTPVRTLYQYMVQAAADTAEALEMGDVATECTLIIFATDNELGVDLDCADVASYDEDFSIPEGQFAVVPKPASTVFFKNHTALESCTFEYLLVGT